MVSGLSPAARKELASLSPEERVEALRALLATDPAEVIAHAVERDPLAAARALHEVLPLEPYDCGCYAEGRSTERLCAPGRCVGCCNACACPDSTPL